VKCRLLKRLRKEKSALGYEEGAKKRKALKQPKKGTRVIGPTRRDDRSAKTAHTNGGEVYRGKGKVDQDSQKRDKK